MVLCRLVPLVFPLLLAGSPINLIHSFLQRFFAGSWPTHYPFNSQGPPPRNAPPDWKLPEMESLQGERTVFYTHLCKKAEEWATQRWPGPFYSQLQQLPCTVSQRGGPTHLPILLAQNLSSKRIAPTDNTQSNFDDDYSRHSLMCTAWLHSCLIQSTSWGVTIWYGFTTKWCWEEVWWREWQTEWNSVNQCSQYSA